MGDSSVANRYIDSEVFDMVNAVLIAHRPPDCSSCGLPLGLVASWSIILTPDNRAIVCGSCPSCAFLPRAVVPEATD